MVSSIVVTPWWGYQENCVLPTVNGGGCNLVWGCMTTAGTGKLRLIEGNMDSNMYCDILKQKMMPSLQKLISNRTNHPKHTTKMTTALLLRWRWWSGQVCLQTWTLLSTCGASSSRRWRSAMCLTSSSSVISLWGVEKEASKQPVQALVNSMHRRIKAVLDNNGSPTRHWHFGDSFYMFTKGLLIFVAR